MWWDAWKKKSRSSSETLMEDSVRAELLPSNPHPNDVDRKRIEVALRTRTRYRYVDPEVHAVAGGYRVDSPCCSRRVDQAGGVIDIALLQFMPGKQLWRVFCKDHQKESWIAWAEFPSLAAVLDLLKRDPDRTFWP